MFKMVSCTNEEASKIGKEVFISDGDVYLTYINEDPKEGVACFASRKDFEVESLEGYKSGSFDGRRVVVEIGNEFIDQRELVEMCNKDPFLSFNGTNLINQEGVRLGYLSQETLEQRLSCKFKGINGFVFKPLVELEVYQEGMPIEEFNKDLIEIENVRFINKKSGGKRAKNGTGKSKKSGNMPFKKKARKQIFEVVNKVEF